MFQRSSSPRCPVAKAFTQLSRIKDKDNQIEVLCQKPCVRRISQPETVSVLSMIEVLCQVSTFDSSMSQAMCQQYLIIEEVNLNL